MSREHNINLRVLFECIASFCLFIMAIIAPIALNLLQIKDTNSQISTVDILVGSGLLCLVALLDIVIAYCVYQIFKIEQVVLSVISCILRIAYGILLFLCLVPLFSFSKGINMNEYYVYFSLFNSNWSKALALFGVHLLFLGILIIRSRFLSWILGCFVCISGFGYIIDTVVRINNPNSSFSISIFTFVGEVLLIIWLPMNGYKTLQVSKQKK